MKKALIVTALSGFIRSFLTNDIKTLQSMGYEIHCAANKNHNGADGMGAYFKENNIIFHQVSFLSNKPLSKETLSSYIELKKIIDKENYDLVHVHTPITGVLTRLICRKKRKHGMKVIYTTHGLYFHKYSSKKSWIIFRTIENWMSKYSDAIITINREDYGNVLNMKCKDVFYIPGVGVDLDRFKTVKVDREYYRTLLNIKPTDFLILAVGELSERKNHKIIIEALSICKLPNAVFMICGNAMTEGNTKEYLEVLAKKYNVDLRLMGLRKDIPEICKCADIGVMPSLREGLGLSGIEMIASGLPLIASSIHGIVDYVKDDVNGYLVDPVSSENIVHAINKLYGLDIRKRIACNCPESVNDFDISHSIKCMKKIYEKILV